MNKERFEFGRNWKLFLKNLNAQQIREAERSLQEWLNMTSLEGKSFLDIGSGSGLFSLAARNLGAKVFSFDYDEDSVKCTKYLKKKFYKNDKLWHIERGNALDKEYISQLGKYDIVYSWGVLHHTGNMYLGLENADSLVSSNGLLFIAIYNDQGWISDLWKKIKKIYNKYYLLRGFILIPFFIILWSVRTINDFIKGQPFFTWRTYIQKRGMSPWIDAIDWVGGYPFETATPEDIFNFFHKKGYTLEKIMTKGGGNACNQFTFRKNNFIPEDSSVNR